MVLKLHYDLVCGVDLGQKADPSAIVLLEVEERPVPGELERIGAAHLDKEIQDAIVAAGQWKAHILKMEKHYTARHINRMPLGTPYTAVAKAIEDIDEKIRRRENGETCTYVVDATGLGAPVIDLLRENIESARIKAAYLTGGIEARIERGGMTLYIPKAQMVSMLQVLLQTGRIHLPKTAEAEALKEELLNYEIRISDAGRDSYGAFKTGSHDDLVSALGIATFYSENRKIPGIYRL